MATQSLSTSRGTTREGNWGADDTEIAVTLAAETGKSWKVEEILFGLDGVPAAAVELTIALDGSTTHMTFTVSDAQPYCIAIPGLYGQDDSAVVVTLAAAGGTVQGYLNVHGRPVQNGTH